MVKRLFGGTSDSVLNQIRKAFTSDIASTPFLYEINFFPVESINKEIKKDTGISDEFIEDLLLTQKDNKYAFSLLALLYPDLDYKNNNFHKDHLHPESKYNKLSDNDKVKYGWQTYNSIKNLQLLDANENMSKNSSDLRVWIEKETLNNRKEKVHFLDSHYIPNVNFDLENFDEYIQVRTEILTKKLKNILN